jgi:organic hydroperoxide reductase OsmC/OhrA
MSQHKAKIEWKCETPDFRLGKYTREHTWAFDGGLNVPASAAPAVVPAPYSNPSNIDPEEAFVASISSCHMLTYLHVARQAGFQVESYEDEAVGDMAKNERGVAWVASSRLIKSSTPATSARLRSRRPSCTTRRTTGASSHSR